MPIFPRPTEFVSFISSTAAASLLLALSGCQSPKTDGKADASKASQASTAQTGKVAPPRAKPVRKSAVDDGCCRYCFTGTPCGDECLPEGKTCDAAKAEGCACTEDKRKPREFAKDYRIPRNGGLLGPDVWNYNQAHGDPIDGPFTLAMAFEGAPELADTSKGTLTAVFETSMGSFECTLYENEAPLTVANFVGLARGVRPFKDPRVRKTTEWTKERYYDGTIFHRVIRDFMIQGGDPTATGRGTPGYVIPDEFDPKLRHDGAGYLSMANRNPYERATQKPRYDEKTGLTVGNTGSAQFFITVRPTKALNDRHTIFGKCDSTVPIEISKVRTQSRPIPDQPIERVVIKKIDFVRK